MSTKKLYSQFVRPSLQTFASQSAITCSQNQIHLNGEDAQKMYLEEVPEVRYPNSTQSGKEQSIANQPNLPLDIQRSFKKTTEPVDFSDKNMMIYVQNNEVDKIKLALDASPDKVNILDDYGWSLLMIACQANAVETVQELLRRGVDTSVRDKAGNSAQSLIIQSKSHVLADLLLNHRKTELIQHKKHSKVKLKKDYYCEKCNKVFLDKSEHLSSTVHNINASKGKKLSSNYVIPESNKGYQIMIKVGWDKESGLGRDGSGNKYPIKAIPKKDKTGLGLDKKKVTQKVITTDMKKHQKHKQALYDKIMEINFRRQFY